MSCRIARDIWGCKPATSKPSHARQTTTRLVPAVVPAPSALSINPSHDAVQKYSTDALVGLTLTNTPVGEQSVAVNDIACTPSYSPFLEGEKPVRQQSVPKTRKERRKATEKRARIRDQEAKRLAKTAASSLSIAKKAEEARQALIEEKLAMKKQTKALRILEAITGKKTAVSEQPIESGQKFSSTTKSSSVPLLERFFTMAAKGVASEHPSMREPELMEKIDVLRRRSKSKARRYSIRSRQ